MIDQGGVKVDGTGRRQTLVFWAKGSFVLQVGKRKFARVSIA
jgi:tyrosyl-tRNA synthetase